MNYLFTQFAVRAAEGMARPLLTHHGVNMGVRLQRRFRRHLAANATNWRLGGCVTWRFDLAMTLTCHLYDLYVVRSVSC